MTGAGDLRPVFVLVTETEAAVRRLTETIGDQGELIVVDPGSLARIVQIIDTVAAALAIVHATPEYASRPIELVGALHATKPLLPVLVLAESLDQELMLSMMRAGACDLFAKSAPREEVRERIHYALEKCAQFAPLQKHFRGKIIAIASARPDADCAILSLHLALAMQRFSSNAKTLLLDLGVPEADALLFLGLQSSYTFVDAVRSTRRFDETLIETAFAKHSSGLALLAMPEEPSSSADITPNDVVVLLNILRSYYTYIVMNLGGLPRSDFLQLTVAHADSVFLLCEQTVPSCRSNKRLVDFFVKNHLDKQVGLVVDRYLEKQEPSAQEIAERLRTPLKATLPPSGLARLDMKNSGRTLFELSPKDKYLQAIERLAGTLLQQQPFKERRRRFAFLRRWLQVY